MEGANKSLPGSSSNGSRKPWKTFSKPSKNQERAAGVRGDLVAEEEYALAYPQERSGLDLLLSATELCQKLGMDKSWVHTA